MKIRYEFATGEVTEVEVSEELGQAIAEMTHRAALKDRAETRRHISLDRLLALGVQIGYEQTSTEELAERALNQAALLRTIETLEPQQRELIRLVYFEGRSCTDIAKSNGSNPRTIRERLYRAQKKIKKVLSRPLRFVPPVAYK